MVPSHPQTADPASPPPPGRRRRRRRRRRLRPSSPAHTWPLILPRLPATASADDALSSPSPPPQPTRAGDPQLRGWLDLSLNHAVVPSSLLILSRAFTLAGRMKPMDAVVATVSSLPDEVVDTIGTVLPSEDSVSERRRKLGFLEMQEELIKEEEKKKEKEEKAKQKKEEKANLTEQEAAEEDLALKEMTEPTAREEEEMIEAKQHDQEQLCNISPALAVLASALSVSKERQEFLSLVNKEIKLYNSMLEREDTGGAEEAKKAYMAAREESVDISEVASEEKVLSALIDKVDAMLQELEKEIDDVDAQIGNHWQLLDSKIWLRPGRSRKLLYWCYSRGMHYWGHCSGPCWGHFQDAVDALRKSAPLGWCSAANQC